MKKNYRKRMKTMIGLAACILVGFINNSVAEDGAPALTVNTGVYSSYVWRGFILDSGYVMQSGANLAVEGFTLGVWASLDGDSNVDEYDYVLDYTYNRDKLSLSVGHTFYRWSTGDLVSREFYAGIGLDVPAAPSLFLYVDYGDESIGGGKGQYLVCNLSHAIALNETAELTIGGHVGYNNALFITGTGIDAELAIGASIPFEGVVIEPAIKYSITAGGLRDVSDGNQGNRLFGGVSITFE